MLYVTLSNGGFENVLLKTEDSIEAIQRAKDEKYYIERDKRKGEVVEIRQYVQNIEDEACKCFDYNLIEF